MVCGYEIRNKVCPGLKEKSREKSNDITNKPFFAFKSLIKNSYYGLLLKFLA
jgi:hypothetical protein